MMVAKFLFLELLYTLIIIFIYFVFFSAKIFLFVGDPNVLALKPRGGVATFTVAGVDP